MRRTFAVLGLLVVGLLLLTGRADAHASLEASTPASGDTLATPPTSFRLSFTDTVDAGTLDLALLDASTGDPAGSLGDPVATGTTVDVGVAGLGDGSYVLTWSSLGDDGHTASGEIAFAVGSSAAASVVTAPPGAAQATTTRGLGTAGRFATYAGAALVAGALWLTRAGAGTDVAEAAPTWLRRGCRLAVVGLALRVVDVVAPQLDNGVLDALTSQPATLLVLAAFPLVALAGRERDVVAGASLAIAAAVLSSAVGHGADDGIVGIGLHALHLVAASLWVGPLAVVAAVAVTTGGPVRTVLHRFSPVAAWSFAVLAVTGLHLGWSAAGGGPMTGYAGVLVAKVALVALVAVPLGWFHRSRVRRPDARPPARSIRVEAAVLLSVLALASVLSGLDPTSVDAAPAAAPAPATPPPTPVGADVTDPADCAELRVGQQACLEAWALDLLDREGPEAAVATIDARSADVQAVKAGCHQLTHTVGQAAAERYDSLAEALAFDASTCWSGYYHGVVAERLDGLPDADIPALCGPATDDRYAMPHYNCVHGLGHGLMLRSEGDLFGSLDRCDLLPDTWEQSTCAGGVFMQDIITGEEGGPWAARPDDLLYPCTAVGEGYKDDCYAMQTSSVLWRNDYDFATAFVVCDGAEAGYVDDCYRSMGRDISGHALLDAPTVAERCVLGRAEHHGDCAAGASANAVYERHDSAAADELCDLVGPALREACLRARDEAAAVVL